MGERTINIAIVGAGVSGMSAALRAIELGASVTLISQCAPHRSGSASVREGLAAVLDARDGDSVELHARDTLRCGDFFASESAVKRMCRSAPAVAELLSRMGLVFDRTPEGTPRLARSLGSSHPRVMQSGRSIGQRLLGILAGQVVRAQSRGRLAAFYGWEFLSPILDDDGRARGVVAQDLRNMEIRAFPADAVILCTGGYPAIFAGHCSSDVSDGAAMVACCERGAAFVNPEFVQLTPFAISAGSKMRSIPDTVLTMGADVWMERDGRPWHFLKEKHAASSGLVPKDVAVRSMLAAAREIAGSQAGGPRIDATHLDPEFVAENMAPFLDACAGAGLDPTREPVEIAPAVLRTLGGLGVDDDHATSVRGLFAAGSAACQYHGASALGGNELLASVHGGTVAAASAVNAAAGAESGVGEVSASVQTHAREREEDAIARISAKEGPENAYAIAWELGRELFERAILEKENEGLARVAGKVEELAERLGSAQLRDRAEWANAELAFHRRLSRRLDLARLYVSASIARDESRGAHHKPASPKRDDDRWMVNTRVAIEGGTFALDHTERVSATPEERGY